MKRKTKMATVMHEYGAGTLRSGSKHGPKVTSHAQAVAIGLSEQRKADAGGYADGGVIKGYVDGGLVQNREQPTGRYAHGGCVHVLKTPQGPKLLSEAARTRFARNSKGN